MGAMWSNRVDDYDYDEDISSNEEEYEIDDGQSSRNKTDKDQSRQPSKDLTENCLDSATDTVDASPRTTMPITLSLNQVPLIEDSLDLYEKVSLVYLLYEDPASALDQLTTLIGDTSKKPIYGWALNQNSLNLKWQEKLVEAICIIQNYGVLKTFGFKRQDLVERFLPHQYQSSIFVNVNKVRKTLYFICDGFGQKDVQSLLSLACSDFQQKKFKFEVFNPIYLELYLLHWEAIGYIKQNDLSNLCGVLKQMDHLDLYDKLKQLVPVAVASSATVTEVQNVKIKIEDKKKPKNLMDRILDPSAGLAELASLESLSADNVGLRNKYKIDTNNPGVCLIINQESFYREVDKKFQHLLPPIENKLETRTGTAQDKEKLVNTFKLFGFKVVTKDNLIHSDMVKKIEEVVDGITNETSLFVCIMSHGDEGVVYGVDSCRVPVKKLKNIMCNRNRAHLSGKPKVLILQSCQGTRCQKVASTEDEDDIVTDGPSSVSEVVPPCADLFTFWATVPGYGAIRNKRTGSWFIQSLCENMKTLGNKCHFEEICTQVVNDVSQKKWFQVNEEVAMVPLKDSTFRKSFFLPPIKA